MFNEMQEHIEKRSKVVSLKHGIGEIVGRFNLYDGVDDYIEVVYFTDESVRYFCIKYPNDVRLLSSRENVDSALRLLDTRLGDNSLDNGCGNLKVDFVEKSVLLIVERIVALCRKNGLGEKEKDLLLSSVNSLVLEVEQVYDVDNRCARGIVSDYMRSA